jgi:hypothetical protein
MHYVSSHNLEPDLRVYSEFETVNCIQIYSSKQGANSTVVFRIMTQCCSLVGEYQHFGGTCCLHLQIRTSVSSSQIGSYQQFRVTYWIHFQGTISTPRDMMGSQQRLGGIYCFHLQDRTSIPYSRASWYKNVG